MAKSSAFPSSSMKPSGLDNFLRTTESLGEGIQASGTWVTMGKTSQEATMMVGGKISNQVMIFFQPETMSSLASQWQGL